MGKNIILNVGMKVADAYHAANWAVTAVHELIDPTPIKIKEGPFKRSRVVKYTPFCKYFVDYDGKKEPINDKPLKLW